MHSTLFGLVVDWCEVDGSVGLGYVRYVEPVRCDLRQLRAPSIHYVYSGHRVRIQATRCGKTNFSRTGAAALLLVFGSGGVCKYHCLPGSLLLGPSSSGVVRTTRNNLLRNPVSCQRLQVSADDAIKG